MASRYLRNQAILLEQETTYNTDPTPTGSANAVLARNISITPLVANNVDRDVIRPYFGASEQLVGTAYVELAFECEMQSSGTAGTAPAFGPALEACGFLETLTAVTRAEYAPVSSAFDSCTIYFHDDGVRHIMTGARGNVEISMLLGEIPVLRFTMRGIVGTVSAQSNPSLTLTAWQTPKVVTDTNTSDLVLGATYTTGSLSGGTAYPSRGLSLNMGNDVNHIPLIGGESIDITNRIVTGSMELDLTAAQEVSLFTDVLANTTGAVSLQHGSSAGFISIVHLPTVQKINPRKSELNGKRLIGYDLRAVPSTSGNDEIRLCFK